MSRSRSSPRKPASWVCVISAEHASNHVPSTWSHLFRGQREVLASHRGWDPGTPEMARAFQQQLGVRPIIAQWSRLLVEPNRSPHHPRLFSEFTKRLPDEQRTELFESFYRPHRLAVETEIRRLISAGDKVVHLGLHSFTPVLSGETRRADIGLLYDPCRDLENSFCRQWQRQLRERELAWVVRRNYPYLGKSDGLTTFLRRQFPDSRYLGIELEVNQKWFSRPGQGRAIINACVTTFAELLTTF